jgi:hypothetical protein
MAAAATNGADEHELPLFQFHPSPMMARYYVQSPSAASHTPSHPASESMALVLSPFPNLHRDADAHHHSHDREEASRLTLSRYSSSRGSNASFVPAAGYVDKKPGRRRQTLTVLSGSGVGDDDDGVGQRSGAWRYVKLDPDASCCRIAFQVAWRVAASAAFALLVFVLATRPRRPGVSFRVGSLERFALGEGLDGSGVETSFLDCNCSVDMVVDNHSKVFSLHVRPPLLEMSFGRFVFATSQARTHQQTELAHCMYWHCHDKSQALSQAKLFSLVLLRAGRGGVARRGAAGHVDAAALRGGAGEAHVRGGARHAGTAPVRPRSAPHHHRQVAVAVQDGGEPRQADVPSRLRVHRAPQNVAATEQRHHGRHRRHLLKLE